MSDERGSTSPLNLSQGSSSGRPDITNYEFGSYRGSDSTPTDSTPRDDVRPDFKNYEFGSYRDESYSAQAEMLADDSPDMSLNTQVITTFADSVVTSGIGSTSGNHAFGGADGTVATDIADFFKRPVHIGNATWGFGSATGDTIPISDTQSTPLTYTKFPCWRVWYENPAVKRKLANFAWFRGDLKLKFQVLASPFYYGHARVTYRPMPNFNLETIAIQTPGSAHLIPFSQRPHVDILPGVSTSFEMTIPFIWNRNWVSLATGPTGSMADLGEIRILTYAPLDSANGAINESLNIVVYAWVENIQLSGATCYVAQSDEYGDGIVSKPASAIASVARRLVDVPVIGPFARATEIGAGAVSSIARLFGWTNVPIVANTMPVRNEQFPKLASTDISYPIEKLTVDSKNELSVDPRIIGLPSGEDEMSIKHLCARESWLCQTSWSTASTINTRLFQTRVNTFMFNAATHNAGCKSVWFTPMGWVTNAFDNWRGTIIFRFHVVCTKYHKGRLLISFDPSGSLVPANNIGALANTANMVHTAILDIGLSNNVEFSVPYQQATQFLRCRTAIDPADSGNRAWNTTDSDTWAINPLLDNGYLTLRVLNNLTAPVASNEVKINVYVKGGDDLEFANPTDVDPTKKMSYYAAQSEVLSEHSPGTLIGSAPTGSTSDTQYLVNFGEKIVSLRPLLRRFNLLGGDYFAPTATTNNMTTFTKKMFKMPISPGYADFGYNSAIGLVNPAQSYPYNWCAFTYMSYFSQGFLGYRGSTNYSFNLSTHTTNLNHIRAYRDNLGAVLNNNNENRAFVKIAFNPVDITSFASANNSVAKIVSTTFSGMSGQSLVNNVTQSGLNVALPNYSPFSFCATGTNYANKPNVDDGTDDDALVLEIQTVPNKSSTERVVVYTYCAAGTDFGFYYFINVPALYYYNAVPSI